MNQIRELFDVLNKKCQYIVLRNWDDIFNECIYGNGHNDIDVLCESIEEFVKCTDAVRVHGNKKRDNFIVFLDNISVRFDVRWVGDGYYPLLWERKMLKNRVINKDDIYTVCPEDYYYTLLYHAFLQKKSLSQEYRAKLVGLRSSKSNDFGEDVSDEELLKDLKKYLESNDLKVEIPQDPVVNINWNNLRKVGQPVYLYRLVYRYIYILGKRLKKIFK